MTHVDARVQLRPVVEKVRRVVQELPADFAK
jgi:hypothetical protein